MRQWPVRKWLGVLLLLMVVAIGLCRLFIVLDQGLESIKDCVNLLLLYGVLVLSFINASQMINNRNWLNLNACLTILIVILWVFMRSLVDLNYDWHHWLIWLWLPLILIDIGESIRTVKLF
ncbi:MAG: hypothetical protein COX77_04425 [Candidatus Komeilibacteria bacterium CG_4_10_14_0_2_um_filter_37_10]|uniref:Uncharacterized protein n=1 Tax=Candidatus Komeilibacteria bacterium CG_4_10_14_0_2_um_filter_37_10 TaxID=1974470 RepID=A0A2M7VDI2_9BACT|nr:MAG: hypothetical protein COX77_04425 [Candidatus Komeilibacteria bacterium CG_4_10_14_0_2_um_filter_37_10]